jgi:hypothetical protein
MSGRRKRKKKNLLIRLKPFSKVFTYTQARNVVRIWCEGEYYWLPTCSKGSRSKYLEQKGWK